MIKVNSYYCEPCKLVRTFANNKSKNYVRDKSFRTRLHQMQNYL